MDEQPLPNIGPLKRKQTALLALLHESVEHHRAASAEPEMLDILLQTNLLDEWIDDLVLEIKPHEIMGPSALSRICEYLIQSALAAPQDRFESMINIVHRLRLTKGSLADALRMALWLIPSGSEKNNTLGLARSAINAVFDSPRIYQYPELTDGILMQLAHIIALHGPDSFGMLNDPKRQLPNPLLLETAMGTHVPNPKEAMAASYTSLEAIDIAQIYEGEGNTQEILVKNRFQANQGQVSGPIACSEAIADIIVNGFVHAGRGSESLLLPDPKGNEWFFSIDDSEILKVLVGATPGIVHLNSGIMGEGLDQVDAFSRADAPETRAGANLAYALTLLNTVQTGEGVEAAHPILCLLGPIANPIFYDKTPARVALSARIRSLHLGNIFRKDELYSLFRPSTPLGRRSEQSDQNMITEETFKALQKYPRYETSTAFLGLGLVYCGTNNETVRTLLIERILFSIVKASAPISLERFSRLYALLALGLVCAGTGDKRIADVILRVIAGHSTNQRRLRYFYFAPMALGLVFLGKVDSAREYINAKGQDSMMAKLLSVRKPDLEVEKELPDKVEQIRFLGFLQSMIISMGGAVCNDVNHIRSMIDSISEATAGRRAAEEHALRLAAQIEAQGSATMPDAMPHRPEQMMRLRPREKGKQRGKRSGRRAEFDIMSALLEGDEDPHQGGLSPSSDQELRIATTNKYESVLIPLQSNILSGEGMPTNVRPGDDNDIELWPSALLDPVVPLVIGLGLSAGSDPLTRQLVTRLLERVIQFGTKQARRAAPLALAILYLGNPDVGVCDTLLHMAADDTDDTSCTALIALGLIGAGSANARLTKRVKSILSMVSGSDMSGRGGARNYEIAQRDMTVAARLCLGLLNLGRGSMTLQCHHSHRRVPSIRSLAGIAVYAMVTGAGWHSLHTSLGILTTFTLTLAMRPTFLKAVGPDGEPVTATVETGKYVDSVGLAAYGVTRLTGAQLSKTPVPIPPGGDIRARLLDEQHMVLTEVMEGVVVLLPAPTPANALEEVD